MRLFCVHVALLVNRALSVSDADDAEMNLLQTDMIFAGEGNPAVQHASPNKQVGNEAPQAVCQTVSVSNCARGTKLLCPQVLLIGTNRGGSTTVADLMQQHPQLDQGVMKEHRFFFREVVTSYVANRTYGNPTETYSLETYRDQYQVPCNTKYSFDASPQTVFIGNRFLEPSFTFRSKPGIDSLEDVKHTLGHETKFIMTIRDPLEWLSSMDLETYPLARKMSCWADSLDGWLSVFPREQFLFLDFDTAFADLSQTAGRIFDFIGVEHAHVEAGTVSGRRRNTRPVTTEMQADYWSDPYFRACKTRLENLTGLKFGWKGS